MRKLKLTAGAVAFTAATLVASSTVVPTAAVHAEETTQSTSGTSTNSDGTSTQAASDEATDDVRTDTSASTSSSIKSWWDEKYNSYGKWGRAGFMFLTAAILLEIAGFVLGPLRSWFDATFNLTPLSSQIELTLGSSARF
ncbi:MAG: hypothetical protein Q3972_07040 [Corynebacterium sp.]|nr:hypothetical protein [Corynebacterium sp.]